MSSKYACLSYTLGGEPTRQSLYISATTNNLSVEVKKNPKYLQKREKKASKYMILLFTSSLLDYDYFCFPTRFRNSYY